MVIDIEFIKNMVAVVSAFALIGGMIFSAYRWYLKQKKQDDDILLIKKEQAILCQGVLACLGGLSQLGANGEVTEAKNLLSEHINQVAHK